VGLVASAASLKTHRRVLEGERATLVAVTVEATRFVGGEGLGHGWARASVGIVAIDAAHRLFRQAVMVGSLELRPDIGMATRALPIDCGSRARDYSLGTVSMY
jgi:hypothetical protein